MARQAYKGLEYTYLNVAFFQDRKIRRLQRRCGESAPLVYIAVLCAIYAEGYYIRWDDDVVLDIADTTRMEEDFISKVIEGCVEVGLLSKEMFEKHHILTSSGIQKQYQFICEKSKRKSTVSEYSLLIPSEEMQCEEPSAAIPSEEIAENRAKSDIPSEVIPHSIVYNSIEKNTIEENRKEDSYSSSLEKEKEENLEKEYFISIMFFNNWETPNKEYQKFVAFNNTGGRCWAKMSGEQRNSAFILWKQEPERPKRFSENLLEFWRKICANMYRSQAPYTVRMNALSDNVRLSVGSSCITINCTADVRDYIENHLKDGFDIIIRELFDSCGQTNLKYICPP